MVQQRLRSVGKLQSKRQMRSQKRLRDVVMCIREAREKRGAGGGQKDQRIFAPRTNMTIELPKACMAGNKLIVMNPGLGAVLCPRLSASGT